MDWQLTYHPDRYFKDICCNEQENEQAPASYNEPKKVSDKLCFTVEHFPIDGVYRESQTELFTQLFNHSLLSVIIEHPRFLHGVLLKNIFEKGKFAFVNIATFEQDENQFIKVSDEWKKNSQQCQDALNQTNKTVINSSYEEFESLSLMDVSLIAQARPDSVFLLTSYRVSGNLEWLEQNWRRWSGVTELLRQLGTDLRRKVARIRFCRRVVAHGEFAYLLLCELASVSSNQFYRLRDLLECLNERYAGYTEALRAHTFY